MPCEEGHFNPTLDAVSAKACTKCPPESTTRTTGAIGRIECECKSGFYDANETEDGVDCQWAPIGTDCQGAATLLNLGALPIAERLRGDPELLGRIMGETRQDSEAYWAERAALAWN